MKKLSTKKVMLNTLAVLSAMMIFGNAQADADECDDQMMITLPFVETTVAGISNLCVSNKGLRGKARATGLIEGNVYTIWWVYFAHPEQCETPYQCGASAADYFGNDPQAVLGRFGSAIADKHGRAHFSDGVDGMVADSGTQIHYLIMGHGAADWSDSKHLARQLLTPEDPGLGVPHLGNIGDGMQGYPVAVGVHVIE